jgi:hypothetical protein
MSLISRFRTLGMFAPELRHHLDVGTWPPRDRNQTLWTRESLLVSWQFQISLKRPIISTFRLSCFRRERSVVDLEVGW